MKAARFIAAFILAILVVYFVRRAPSPGTEGRKISGRLEGPSRDVAALTRVLERPAILVRHAQTTETSFFGGAPPAFPGFTWPARSGRPLGFLACIDLAALPAGSGLDWIPSDGRLLFYYDMEEQPWGDPKDRDGWKVLYVPASAPINGEAPLPAGLKQEWRVERRFIRFVTASLPPPPDDPAIEALKLSDTETDRYLELSAQRYGAFPHHQIGGFPDPVQNDDMEMECQMASNEPHGGDESGDRASGDRDPTAPGIREGAGEWSLLFQIDSDDELDVMWGDAGMLYFWVRREDARKHHFDGVWMVLQCS